MSLITIVNELQVGSKNLTAKINGKPTTFHFSGKLFLVAQPWNIIEIIGCKGVHVETVNTPVKRSEDDDIAEFQVIQPSIIMLEHEGEELYVMVLRESEDIHKYNSFQGTR